MDVSDLQAELKLLDPKRIRVWRDAFGDLHLEVCGEDGQVTHHEKVKPMRAFPLTMPDKFISFLDDEDNFIGLVKDLNHLEGDACRILEEELEKRYFLPRIIKVHSVKVQMGITVFEAETDRGPRTFEVRSRDDFRFIPPHRVVITDADGNRYDLPNLNELDPKHRETLEQLV